MPRQLPRSLSVLGCVALLTAACVAGCAGAGSRGEARPYDPRWMERPERKGAGVPIRSEVVSGLLAAGYDGVAAACGESRGERAERKRRRREREAEEDRRRPWRETEERAARRRAAGPEKPVVFIRPPDAP